MKTVSIRFSDMDKKTLLYLGYVGENLHRRILIDCKKEFEEMPGAIPALVVTAPNGLKYPVDVTVEGNTVIWDITNSDLIHHGNGEIQLTLTKDEEVGKSAKCRTKVDESIEPDGEAPDPIENWLIRAENLLREIPEEIAQAIEEAKESGMFDGVGISSIGYVRTVDNVNIYRITLTDRSFYDFEVSNGEDGQPGTNGVGIANIAKTGTVGLVDTYTITLTNGQTYPFTVTNGQNGAEIDDTTPALNKVFSSFKVNEELTQLKSALTLMGDESANLEKRAQNVDGLYYLPPSNFEIGNLSYSSSGWSYPAGNTTRVRTKQGVSFKLAVGDVVSLSSYTNAKFYLSWKNTSDVYKNSDWKTVDYTITEAGDYVILLTNLTEVTQTSIDALYGLLSIKKANYGIKSLETEIEKRDKNILLSMFGTADVPIDTNQIYNGSTHTFTSNPNRISFAEPYQFNTGDKLYVDVASGEKFYLLYFNRVNNTGVINTDFVEISGSATGWKTADTEYVSDGEKYVFVMVAFSGDTKITTDTVKTKITLTKATLPDYWKSYLTTKAGDINTAMDAVGGIGDAFVFYTDPHWGSKNQKHTPQIIKFLLENTSLREVYCGGDVIDSSSGGFTGYARSFRDITVFTARGNHDQNPNASDATDIVPDTEYYNRILKPIEHIVETNGKLYFYRDNPSAKIRYIFMDSGSARADTLDTTQLTWMQNALTSLTSGWSAVVIQHIVWDGAYASSATLSLATQGTKTINAINDVWAQMNCQFIGIISGHVHRDYSITESTHGYPIIATSCDVGGTGRTDYDPDNPVTPGTTNEHIMDVFIIDKTNRAITVKRIGAGSDRSFTYPAMS